MRCPPYGVNSTDWSDLVPSGAVLHKGDGSITVIEFSDFQCPFCSRARPVLDSLAAMYPDRLTLVYRHFPISTHPYAVAAAEASECANEQGVFKEFHDQLFDRQGAIGSREWGEFAVDAGVEDLVKFTACVDNRKYREKVEADAAIASKYQLGGTPTFLVNGNVVRGARPLQAFLDHIN